MSYPYIAHEIVVKKLKENLKFTDKQIEAIQYRYLPTFKDDCDLCRFNLKLEFNIATPETSHKHA